MIVQGPRQVDLGTADQGIQGSKSIDSGGGAKLGRRIARVLEVLFWRGLVGACVCPCGPLSGVVSGVLVSDNGGCSRPVGVGTALPLPEGYWKK